MTQKSAAKERSAAAAVGLREGAFLGGMFLFVKSFLCVWQLETLFLCIFTLTFLLLEVVVIKTNLFCVFRAMPSSLSSSANRVFLVVVSLNDDDLRSRVYRHRRHTTL